MEDATPPDYFTFKLPLWKHQHDAFLRLRDSDYGGILFEQRCGKTATVLNIAAHKCFTGKIDSLLVVAPAGVHRNWTQEEIPTHFPLPYRAVLWQSSKMASVKARRELDELLTFNGGLRILSVNIDALITKNFRDYLTRFFFRRRVMTVIDESSDISSDRAQRSKMAIKIGRRSKARFILDGTPVSAGPLGLYSQCDFLASGALGFTSFVAFRARYAELEGKDVGEKDKLCPLCFNAPSVKACSRCNGLGFIGRNQIQVVKSFLNTDELQAKLKTFSVRVLRSDCHDLPPKIFTKVFVDLPPGTRKIYDDMRTTFIAELRSGGIVTAPMVLTRYLRLQQIASGFLPVELQLVPCPVCQGGDEACPACDGLGVVEDETAQKVEEIGVVNGRLEALAAELEKTAGQSLIWTRFTFDVEKIMALARRLGKIAVRYDGKVKPDERADNVRRFQAGEADWFVGSPRAGGRGIDLARADNVFYYSHYWSLRTRLQSEDRAQSLKKTTAVGYTDFIATDTVDDKIVAALRAGKRLSDLITGDNVTEWL